MDPFVDTGVRPTVVPAFSGESHKVFKGSSDASAYMPEHYSTHEAVVVVTSGRVTVRFSDNGDTVSAAEAEFLTIPANRKHTLKSDGAFTLFLTIPATAELKFG